MMRLSDIVKCDFINLMVIGDTEVLIAPLLYDHINSKNREFVHVPEYDNIKVSERVKMGYIKIRGEVGYFRNKDAQFISWCYGVRWLRDDHLRRLNVCKLKDLNKESTIEVLQKKEFKLLYEDPFDENNEKIIKIIDNPDLNFLANLYTVLSRNTIIAMVAAEPL